MGYIEVTDNLTYTKIGKAVKLPLWVNWRKNDNRL